MKKHFFWSLLLTMLFMTGLVFQGPEQTDIVYRLLLFVVGMLAGGFWGTFLLMAGIYGAIMKGDIQIK